MSESVHGRNVLKMVLAADKPQPREQLIEAITAQFGADAHFHTCSVQGLSANNLLELFMGKGKLVESAEGITADASRICGHH
ncbi:YecH family metal-binding protein [Sansalvadorimonas verongulae]|uniref:YecH family metal-binding protein n=1 Tax=Sansalvadorimonas verongulae TaxID=2172824 RepID=UPI0012BC1D1B|nr:YecH family metal-binding protein [Sansalvadorimonas verongulae]MTI13516.1 DUF2492 family protein [Sansalvadorimonas verongulae]